MNLKNKPRVFNILGYLMTGLFLLSAAAQYNDSDGLYWIGFYGTAALVTWLVLLEKLHWYIPGLLALATLTGSCILGYDIISDGSLDQITGASWQMQNLAQEKARESGGMLIVGIWLMAMAVKTRRERSHGSL